MSRDEYVAGPVESVEKVCDIFACAASVVVGDLVRVDSGTSDTVATVTSNTYSGVVIGIVSDKPTSTTCEICLVGRVEGLSGLTFGSVVWVHTDGTPTTTRPTSGHIQKIGVAITSTAMVIMPSLEKVILN